MKKVDFYAVLGIAKTATQEEVKAGYRKMALKYHPDHNPGDKTAGERFKEIVEAYGVLLVPEKRLKYDKFGSGTLVGAKTHIARTTLVDPLTLEKEAGRLSDLGQTQVWERLTIDEQAPLTTGYHVWASMLREQARGNHKHGSTGMGIWETQRTAREYPLDVPRVGDMRSPAKLTRALEFIRDLKVAEMAPFQDANKETKRLWINLHQRGKLKMNELMKVSPHLKIVDGGYLEEILDDGVVVFEGSQGVLLDENWGFHPYTTGSTTTFDNAALLLREVDFHDWGDIRKIGVIRTYMTRHGVGPLPTEIIGYGMEEQHNLTQEYTGVFRSGPLDLVLLQYALDVVGGVDGVAITHVDFKSPYVATWYEGNGRSEFFEGTERWSRIKISGRELENHLVHQEKLARVLSKMKPNMIGVPASLFPAKVGHLLGVRVNMISVGPTERDQMFF